MTAPTLALQDRRAVAAASQCEFREGWSFKGKPEPVIDRMIGATPGPIIHGCCGAARLVREDLRVDLYHPSADRKWDLREIDKRCAEEGIRPGTIFIDPPYGKKMWPLPYRQKVVNACMRALRPGGLLIVHAPWQPKFNKVAKREGFYWREDNNLGFPDGPVLLVAYRKTDDPAFDLPQTCGSCGQRMGRHGARCDPRRLRRFGIEGGAR